ncbi:MAG: helix-turn-helix domain-containing protein [Sphingobacterium sp.]|jgi:AraC-like DNA-binding protein|nr:helix-turn-helix domain-containing protein [Sphingobacterium sp.]
MFETGIIRKTGNLHRKIGAQYIFWQGKQYKTDNNLNEHFTIALTVSSGGTHTIDFIDYKMRGQQLHLIFPGQVAKFSITENTKIHLYRIAKKNFEMFCFALQYDISLYKKYPVQPLTVNEFQGLLYEIEKISHELNADKPLYEMIGARTTIIFQEISRIAEGKIKDIDQYTISPLVFAFINLVEEKFREERTVEYYANALNLSANYLSILTRKHMDISAINIIKNRVLLEAKRMLIYSGKSVKTVMFELGFNEQSYFSYYFKALTGISPSVFRKKSREP